MVVGSLGSVLAIDQPADPGGAPAPKSGPFQPSGFVRVVTGDSLEMVIDDRRVAVGVVGIDTPPLSTPCGKAARAETQALVGRGAVLQDDPAVVLDQQKRRMYRVSAPDGRSVAATLVSEGLARANGLGSEAATLSVLESQARQAQAGCVWGGPVPEPRSAAARQQTTIRSTAPGANSARADGSIAEVAGSVLPSFADDTVVSGLTFPTSFAFLPDGRVLVTEKDGRVRLVSGGSLQPTPVLSIESKVNAYWDRGLLGIAVDPSFTSNRYFYIFATYENDAAHDTGPKTSQVVRYTLRPDNTADPNGTVILGTVTGAGCPDPSTLADCIPAEGASHSGGSLRFGSDGYLYVSVGDAASFTAVDPLALRAQDPNSLAGKILRITSTGQGVNGNPFWDGDAGHPRSKVWARGFRNPFRITLRPGNPPMPYVGDVGWSTWEEIDVVPAGVNAGWPCYEGNHVQSGYASYPVCASLYADGPSAVRAPATEWPHNGGGGAALAGTFYTGTAFPPTYQGAFFYADYANGWVRSVTVDNNHQFATTPTQFAGSQSGLVQMDVGPDGALWYMAIGSGELRRIYYAGNYTPLQCPNGQFRAEYYTNTQSLSGAPAVQRCETSINYDWGFGPPIDGVSLDNFSVRWTGRFPFGNDTYTFTTSSDDGVRIFVDGELILNDWASGAENIVTANKVMTAGDHTVTVEYFEDCCPAVIRASWVSQTANTAPAPTITAPAAGATFKVGDVIQLQGSASDAQDGALSGASLRWDVIQKHCPGFGSACHDHPLQTFTGATAQFTAPDHGDGSYFEIRLTATDSRGVSTTISRQVDPRTLQITLATSPGGGTVVYDGTAQTAPYTVKTIAGSTHSIEVQIPTGQSFLGWSQGGAQKQNVTVGEQDVTYTASFGTPGQPNPPTPPATSCSPRPNVTITTAPGSGRRMVTVSTTTNPGAAANTLKSIRFDESRLAKLDVPQYPVGPAPFTATYAAGTTHTTFAIVRTAPGPLLVRFTVTDDCGTWPTFVGAGTDAGW